MMILCSPHNPVGRVWAPEELIRTADICQKHNVFLVSDEIHCDLVRRGVTHTPTRLLSEHDKIITCTSASKTFNLAGLQTCNCIVPDEKIRQEWQAEQRGRMGLSSGNAMGLAATQAAYNHGKDWLEQVLDYLDANLQFMAEVDRVNEHFARVENVRKFLLLTKELDHDDDELTATMKVRRANIYQKFATEIEQVYGGGARA